jgi:hypothetical protein
MKSSPAYREHFEKTLPEHEAQAPWTRTAEGLQYHVPQTDPGGGRGGTFIPTDVEAEHLRRQFPDQPDVFLEDLSGLTSPVPSIEDVLAEPTAMTPEPPPPADRSQMPTTGGDSGVEAAPTQMYSYVDEDGNRVFTNIPGQGRESYDTGVEEFKQRAMTRAQTRAAEPQLPQGLDVPPVGMGRDPGRVRPAPTMGRTRGDFDDLVRPGRGGFSPSAEVPEAGTISQAEYQQLTPGQQRAYDREFAGWVTRLQAEMQVDPLAAYNRASEQIMKQPVYAAKLTALKADLDKMVEAQQISPEQYEMALAGAQQQIVQEAMMAMGVAGASLDPRTHQRTGVLGY